MKFLCCIEEINGKFCGNHAVPISEIKSITHHHERFFHDEDEPIGDVWNIRLHSDSDERARELPRQCWEVEIVDSERVLETIKKNMRQAEEWNTEFDRCHTKQTRTAR